MQVVQLMFNCLLARCDIICCERSEGEAFNTDQRPLCFRLHWHFVQESEPLEAARDMTHDSIVITTIAMAVVRVIAGLARVMSPQV